MVTGQPQGPEAVTAPSQEAAAKRTSRTLHRVPSKQLGSGSGAGLWVSNGSSPEETTLASAEASEGPAARVHFHDSAKAQAVSPTSAQQPSRGSKLYHFPATLARGLRFHSADGGEMLEQHHNEPVAKLQEHNLLRMSSKEELEASVDLDLSFDYMSTAERPLPTAQDGRAAYQPVNLQAAFVPSDHVRPASLPAEDVPASLTTTSSPNTAARASPGRGMAATDWSSRSAKQPPAPLDLTATNPAKILHEKAASDKRASQSSVQSLRPSISSLRSVRPSIDMDRNSSIMGIHSSDSARMASTPGPDTDSMSIASQHSQRSQSSRGSRAPPTQPPTGPLPPIPDGRSSKRTSLSSSRFSSPMKSRGHAAINENEAEELLKDEDREELRDSFDSSAVPDLNPKRTSQGSGYSGESGESFQTAAVASIANSSADNIAGSASGSQSSMVPPLPAVPSVIWKQRQQRIERQVAAAATTRASAVHAAFAIESVAIDNSVVARPPQPPADESPRMSFGFQSPTPDAIKRWSSIPSQLAAIAAAANGPIMPPAADQAPAVPALPENPHRDTLSPHDSRQAADTPNSTSSTPFSPLFSDPGTAVSAATTMSRGSTQSGYASKAEVVPASSLGHASSSLGEDPADATVTQFAASSTIGPQSSGGVGTAKWIKDQSSQTMPSNSDAHVRDSQLSTGSSVHRGTTHTRQTTGTTGVAMTSDSELDAEEEQVRRLRLPMQITTTEESDGSDVDGATSALGLHNLDPSSAPWPQSPLLLTQDASGRMSKEYRLSQTSQASRMRRSSHLTSMMGLGLGLDLGLGADLQPPQDAATRDSILRKVASESGLAASTQRQMSSPHTELDMTLFADQGPEPTVANMYNSMHKRLSSRRSRLLDMLHGTGQHKAVPPSPGTALALPTVIIGPQEAMDKAHAADTPSTLPMLSPLPMSSPYLGRVALDITNNSSVEAFACNVTPPMPSVPFPDRQLSSVQRAAERKSEGHVLGSNWQKQAHEMRSRFSYRIATASWLPHHPGKQDLGEPSTRPIKEKQSPLPAQPALFESTTADRPDTRVSIASGISSSESRMRRRRSTMTTTWAPASDPAALLRSVPRTMALGQAKKRRSTGTIFGNAAFSSPSRMPTTTTMLPGGTLLSKTLFYAGFCGMPWLWLVGGWWLGPDGMLIRDGMTRVEVYYEDEDDSEDEEQVYPEHHHHLSESHEHPNEKDGSSDWYHVERDPTAEDEIAIAERNSAEHFHNLVHGPNSIPINSSLLHPRAAGLERGGSAEGQQSSRSGRTSERTRSATVVTYEHATPSTEETGPYPRVRVSKAKKSGSSFAAEYVDAALAVQREWEGLEQYVRLNRFAALVGACVIFAAVVFAIYGIASNW